VITPDRARISEVLPQVVDGLVDLIAAGVVERLQPQLGELVALRASAAPASREPGVRSAAPTDLLTIAEAAKVLNVAKSTVAFWIHRTKTLPCLHIGPGPGRRLVRIRRSDLEAFITDGPRARERAVELLAASERRSEDRRRRRLERGHARPTANVRPLRAPATR
jgi:excisionase family DNA binding protein